VASHHKKKKSQGGVGQEKLSGGFDIEGQIGLDKRGQEDEKRRKTGMARQRTLKSFHLLECKEKGLSHGNKLFDNVLKKGRKKLNESRLLERAN